jgi:hypothetical protein
MTALPHQRGSAYGRDRRRDEVLIEAAEAITHVLDGLHSSGWIMRSVVQKGNVWVVRASDRLTVRGRLAMLSGLSSRRARHV